MALRDRILREFRREDVGDEGIQARLSHLPSYGTATSAVPRRSWNAQTTKKPFDWLKVA